jgi:hypothetical protein
VVLDLMTVKFLLHYSTRPIQIFGRIGLVFAAIALAMLGAILVDRLFIDHITTDFLIKRPFWVITPADAAGILHSVHQHGPAGRDADSHLSRVAGQAHLRHPRVRRLPRRMT